ncbi:unnamed protein product [Oikopleura dioica]|uniref:C3H1-type domain-containing protein n=1 Tax=Oikopleura dioica TaxID=34765 RepID=E4XEX4_OIKDI|nr:unnamed protein product [Oikopleura dioica]
MSSAETLKFFTEYAGQLEKEIADGDAKNADIKMKIKLRNEMMAKIQECVGAFKADKTLSRDQANSLKSAETALTEISYTGRDFDETATFCGRVDQLYDAYVNGDSELEESFCAKVKLRFKSSTYSRVKNAEEELKTWTQLRDWLNKNFDSGLSSIQLLQRSMETHWDSNQGWKRYAQEIEIRMEPARHAIYAQIRKSKAAKSGKPEKDKVNEPKADDIFSFISTSIVAGRLKVVKPHLHALLANEWQGITDSPTLATKIEFLLSQTSGGGSVFFAQSNYKKKGGGKGDKKKESGAGKDGKKAMPVCLDFMKGKCDGTWRGKPCRFSHEIPADTKSRTLVAKAEELPEEKFSTVFH